MGSIDLRVGGVWLSGIAPVGGVHWSFRARGDCYEASWHLSTLGRAVWSLPTFLRRGQIVEVFAGPRVWKGTLSAPEPVDGGWDMTAVGLYEEGGRRHAEDATFRATSIPNTAIDRAIIDKALPWTRLQSFSSTAVVTDDDVTDDVWYVNELLDKWAEEAGEVWGVDANGVVWHRPLPTEPMWVMAPGPHVPGPSDTDYASHVYGRYQKTDGTWATVRAIDEEAAERFGRAEIRIVLKDRKQIATSRAQLLVDNILAKGKARLGWTDSLEPGRWDLLTYGGGVPADFRHVRAGQMVRLHGVMDPTTARMKPIDFVIGEVEYDADENHLTITPLDAEASTLPAAIERATKGLA